jgi:hypothetical protein
MKELRVIGPKPVSGKAQRRWASILAPLALAVVAGAAAGCGGGGTSNAPLAHPAATQARPTLAASVDSELVAEAGAAQALARSYQRTAREIARVRVTTAQAAPKRRLLAALRKATHSYRALAAAADAGNEIVYTSRLQPAEQSRQLVRRTMTAFRARVPASPLVRQPRDVVPVPSTRPPCAGDGVSDDPSSDDACNEADENENEADENENEAPEQQSAEESDGDSDGGGDD